MNECCGWQPLKRRKERQSRKYLRDISWSKGKGFVVEILFKMGMYLWVCLWECWREYVSVYVREKAFGVASWCEIHFVLEVTVRNVWKPYLTPNLRDILTLSWSRVGHHATKLSTVIGHLLLICASAVVALKLLSQRMEPLVLKELTADLEIEMGFITNTVDLTRVKVLNHIISLVWG